MKQLIAIVLSVAALTAFAAEPAKTATPPAAGASAPAPMKLAKKKSEKDAEAKAAKAANKSQPAKKTEATKK